jgi:hypothetical protein
MAGPAYSKWPLELDQSGEDYLIDSLKDVGLSLGFSVKYKSPEIGESAALAPITLFPSLFPKSCFETAKKVQKSYNDLYISVASDVEWLDECIKQ